jgi:hypothetical protein
VPIPLLLRLANPLCRRRLATTAAKCLPNFWFSVGISSGSSELDGGGEAARDRLGDVERSGNSAPVGDKAGVSPGSRAQETRLAFLRFFLIFLLEEGRVQGLETAASASNCVLGNRPLLSAGPSGVRCLTGDGVINSRKDLMERVNSGVGRLELYLVGVEGIRGE